MYDPGEAPEEQGESEQYFRTWVPELEILPHYLTGYFKTILLKLVEMGVIISILRK